MVWQPFLDAETTTKFPRTCLTFYREKGAAVPFPRRPLCIPRKFIVFPQHIVREKKYSKRERERTESTICYSTLFLVKERLPRSVEADAVHVLHEVRGGPVLVSQGRPLSPGVEVRRNLDVVLEEEGVVMPGVSQFIVFMRAHRPRQAKKQKRKFLLEKCQQNGVWGEYRWCSAPVTLWTHCKFIPDLSVDGDGFAVEYYEKKKMRGDTCIGVCARRQRLRCVFVSAEHAFTRRGGCSGYHSKVATSLVRERETDAARIRRPPFLGIIATRWNGSRSCGQSVTIGNPEYNDAAAAAAAVEAEAGATTTTNNNNNSYDNSSSHGIHKPTCRKGRTTP